jgi:MinD-like ATPase involved in chromosome partitioning or flagellar assembly
VSLGERSAVLLAAGGAAWEVDALRRLETGAPRVVLRKRCVDLHDLLASATTGEARVAVVDTDLAGLDADSIALLRRAGVASVLVSGSPASAAGRSASALGATCTLSADRLDGLVAAVVEAAEAGFGDPDGGADPGGREPEAGPVDAGAPSEVVSGGSRAAVRTVAVWGPTGAPGRTTVAIGLAAGLAARGGRTLLADVDGYGGAAAQHLGVLDEVSGLLAAARLANAGRLDATRLTGLLRRVSPGLDLLSGLPRADRWVEVRPTAFEQVLDLARTVAALDAPPMASTASSPQAGTPVPGHVVLDTGFCLETDPTVSFGSSAPQRNQMTLASLEVADDVVVVGAADPVGLTRLARGLVELVDAVPGCRVHVVVNRHRATLGWSRQEVRAMVEGFVSPAGVHFLPDDREAADRAVMTGRSVMELDDAPLRRALGDLVDAVAGGETAGQDGRRRRRPWRRAG